VNVTLTLKEWKVARDEKTKLPKLQGTYALVMGEKAIATQEFNGPYTAEVLPFTGELLQEILAFEDRIRGELAKILA
jgi:hypothetical protein